MQKMPKLIRLFPTVNVQFFALYIFSRYSRFRSVRENMYIVKSSFIMPDIDNNLRIANFCKFVKVHTHENIYVHSMYLNTKCEWEEITHVPPIVDFVLCDVVSVTFGYHVFRQPWVGKKDIAISTDCHIFLLSSILYYVMLQCEWGHLVRVSRLQGH